jgi:hypothetical protein
MAKSDRALLEKIAVDVNAAKADLGTVKKTVEESARNMGGFHRALHDHDLELISHKRWLQRHDDEIAEIKTRVEWLNKIRPRQGRPPKN